VAIIETKGADIIGAPFLLYNETSFPGLPSLYRYHTTPLQSIQSDFDVLE
jgi:hypothetical protein